MITKKIKIVLFSLTLIVGITSCSTEEIISGGSRTNNGKISAKVNGSSYSSKAEFLLYLNPFKSDYKFSILSVGNNKRFFFSVDGFVGETGAFDIKEGSNDDNTSYAHASYFYGELGNATESWEPDYYSNPDKVHGQVIVTEYKVEGDENNYKGTMKGTFNFEAPKEVYDGWTTSYDYSNAVNVTNGTFEMEFGEKIIKDDTGGSTSCLVGTWTKTVCGGLTRYLIFNADGSGVFRDPDCNNTGCYRVYPFKWTSTDSQVTLTYGTYTICGEVAGSGGGGTMPYTCGSNSITVNGETYSK